MADSEDSHAAPFSAGVVDPQQSMSNEGEQSTPKRARIQRHQGLLSKTGDASTLQNFAQQVTSANPHKFMVSTGPLENSGAVSCKPNVAQDVRTDWLYFVPCVQSPQNYGL